MTFTGFGPDALAFYEGLAADNSRAYFTEHKAVYDARLRAPMEALLADLEGEFGGWKIFRPNRDVRFSADKSPYKTTISGVAGGDGSEDPAWYLQLGLDGLLAGAGMYVMDREQLGRYREAVQDDRRARALERAIASAYDGGLDHLDEPELKRAPRGVDPQHPRIDLLRRKGLTLGRTHEPGPWLETDEPRDYVRATWRACRPLCDWLADHVGPPREAPPEPPD